MSRTSTLVIAMHALPDNQMPYYLSYLMSLGRMLMTLFILGPPKAPKKQDPVWKTAVMLVCRSGLLCMAVYALVIDAKLMQEIYTEAHSTWELISRCSVVIVTSPNFVNAMGNSGIAVLYRGREVWMDLHEDPTFASFLRGGLPAMCYLKLPPGFYEQVGVVGVAYWYVLWFPYFSPSSVVSWIIANSCSICYFWFYFPLCFVMHLVNVKVVEPCMDTAIRNTSPDEGLLPFCEPRAEIISLLGLTEDDYYVETRWFHTLGFPKWAFTGYLLYTLMLPILLPLATIMFVRLIDGLGYWDAFYITCSERTMAGYISHLVGNAESQVAIIENLLR